MHRNWRPFFLALGFAALINGFPLFMAFVLRASGWAELGWVWYLISIPGTLLLVLTGLLLARRKISE